MNKFREAIEEGVQDDGYEPQQLWLIPIFLRSLKRYYDDVVRRIRSEIDDLWKRSAHYYDSRASFEASRVAVSIWDRNSPLWWGLNDIAAYIDVRACVRVRQIQASLFLTRKRPSNRLVDKKYAFQRSEVVEIPNYASNADLQQWTIEAVERIARDPRLKKRYMDLDHWRRLVRHTDLGGIIRESAQEDLDRIAAGTSGAI